MQTWQLFIAIGHPVTNLATVFTIPINLNIYDLISSSVQLKICLYFRFWKRQGTIKETKVKETETSRNPPKFGKQKSRFHYLCLCVEYPKRGGERRNGKLQVILLELISNPNLKYFQLIAEFVPLAYNLLRVFGMNNFNTSDRSGCLRYQYHLLYIYD